MKPGKDHHATPPGAVAFDDLPPDLQAKLSKPTHQVSPKMLLVGRILNLLEGHTRRDACWALRKVIKDIEER